MHRLAEFKMKAGWVWVQVEYWPLTPPLYLSCIQEKAHKLGRLLVRQEEQNLELQQQVSTLRAVQAVAATVAALQGAGRRTHPGDDKNIRLGVEELEQLRREVQDAKANLEKQSGELAAMKADYQMRHGLLRKAAGQWCVLSCSFSNSHMRIFDDKLPFSQFQL